MVLSKEMKEVRRRYKIIRGWGFSMCTSKVCSRAVRL